MSTTATPGAVSVAAGAIPPASSPSWSQRKGASAGSVPASSLPPFWLLCALTLIVSHYQIWQRFNVGYKVLGVLVVLAMPLTAGFMRMLSRPAVLWLLAFEGVMVANMLLGRYLPDAMFSTASHPVQLIRALPLMLCGYTLARYPASEKRFFFLVSLVYLGFSVVEVQGFIVGAGEGLDRAKQYTQTFGLDDVRAGAAYVGAFVYFAPLLLFLAIALMRLYPCVNASTRIAIFVVQGVFVAVGLFSGFGAMLVLLLVAAGLLVVFAPVRTLGQRLAYACLGATALAAFNLLGSFFSSEVGRGGVSSAFWKLSTFLIAIFSGGSPDSSAMLELGSSSRWSLMLKSLQTFFAEPVLGHGLLQQDYAFVGQHSFFFDTAAVFGLIGLIPAAAFFVVLARSLLRARRAMPSSWEVTSSLVFLGAFTAGNFFNPYFMGMLSLTYFEFLNLGFCLADGERPPQNAGVPSRDGGREVGSDGRFRPA
jgi:hypothetical protein